MDIVGEFRIPSSSRLVATVIRALNADGRGSLDAHTCS